MVISNFANEAFREFCYYSLPYSLHPNKKFLYEEKLLFIFFGAFTMLDISVLIPTVFRNII